MTTYYDRATTLALDGSPIFKSDEDETHEREVADVIEEAWRCRLHAFGRLSAIDWWAERDGRMVGLLELKSRSHASEDHDTVYLNVRKWLALSLGQAGLGAPSIFVVQFTNCIKYITLNEIDATQIVVGGTRRPVKSRSDIEPVILVPLESMREVNR